MLILDIRCKENADLNCRIRIMNFAVTLHKTDVGYGQVTPGTYPRSPEVFIPLAARNTNPDFWGWPHLFAEDPQKSNKFDRLNVRALLDGRIIFINMMTWPDKSDFRLRCSDIREAANIGDILFISNNSDTYEIRVVSRSDSDYDALLQECTNKTHNSEKLWGYF